MSIAADFKQPDETDSDYLARIRAQPDKLRAREVLMAVAGGPSEAVKHMQPYDHYPLAVIEKAILQFATEAPNGLLTTVLRRADECRAYAEASLRPAACHEYRAKEAAFREVVGLIAAMSPRAGGEEGHE